MQMQEYGLNERCSAPFKAEHQNATRNGENLHKVLKLQNA